MNHCNTAVEFCKHCSDTLDRYGATMWHCHRIMDHYDVIVERCNDTLDHYDATMNHYDVIKNVITEYCIVVTQWSNVMMTMLHCDGIMYSFVMVQ